MALEQVQISVADAHLSEFGEVVRRLEVAGLQVEQQLAAVGVITGRIETDQVDGLSGVEGVEQVERTGTVGIPPGELGRRSQDTDT